MTDYIANALDAIADTFDRLDGPSNDSRVLALIAGILCLAGPRRTRPLAGLLYGAFLSRAHGAGLQRLSHEAGDTIGRLFSERTSVAAELAELKAVVAAWGEVVDYPDAEDVTT